jgi:RNA polymerase sigma-70 factor (ECF subfamily)
VNDTNVLASDADLAIVERLRAGDETTFMMLVEQHQAPMLRIARMYVSSRAVAEEVVQDAWLGIIRGLDGFEGRSSLRTWMYRIVANLAKTRGQREGRSVPFSSLAGDDTESAIDPEWFHGPGERLAGGWRTHPDDWRGIPEERLIGNETLARIARAIDSLPAMQAEVIRLRDVLGWTSEEVRNALDLSETNQRVLLHRARARVRRELGAYLSEGPDDW